MKRSHFYLKPVSVTFTIFFASLIFGAANARADEPQTSDSTAQPSGHSADTSAVETKIPFHYVDGDLLNMIAAFAKASGRNFIVSPAVRGKISVFTSTDVSLQQAYDVLTEALAINGFTVVEEGDTTIVKSSRDAQRDMIPTLTHLPPVKPNRMVTMIFKMKYVSAEDVNRLLRILPSKDGEMSPYGPTNALIVSDYAANINRIAEIINQLDVPQSAKPSGKLSGSSKVPPPPPRPAMKAKTKTGPAEAP